MKDAPSDTVTISSVILFDASQCFHCTFDSKGVFSKGKLITELKDRDNYSISKNGFDNKNYRKVYDIHLYFRHNDAPHRARSRNKT